MKKLGSLLLMFSLYSVCAFAQTTNTFPASGNVGIGTTSPAYKFHSVSTGNTTATSAFLYGDYYGAIIGTNNTTSSYYAFGVASGISSTGSGGTRVFSVLGNGNVGIGAQAPSDLLEINNGSTLRGLTISGDGSGGTLNYMGFKITTTTSIPVNTPIAWTVGHRKDGFFSGNPSGQSSLEFYSALKTTGATTYLCPLSFRSNGDVVLASQLNTYRSGNVLIGKTSQSNTAYKLDVAGSIRSNQIVVNTTGADFVFDRQYHLRELSSVQKFISKNHHLPEISSAESMKETGLDLGDNQIKLLQKIEELTLYLIEKDKQMNEIRAEQRKQSRIQRHINEKLKMEVLKLAMQIKRK